MPDRPNLVFITSDEMRGDCLAANGRNPDIRTPHLDAFAAKSALFRQHYTTFPKCVPARISMATGRYCHTDGYRNIFYHMPSSQPDLLSSLLGEDYEVALFGKNHCWDNIFEATHTPPELKPGEAGHRIAHHSWTAGFKDIYEALQAKMAPQPEERAAHKTAAVKPFDAHWGDEAYTRQAIHFLDHVRDKSRPFYLHVNIESPHPPYVAAKPDSPFHYDPQTLEPFPHDLPEHAPLPLQAQRQVRLEGKQDEATLRSIQAAYYSMVSRVDEQVGRILAALEAQGLMENSVVVFLSDHGDFAGQYSLPEKWDTVFSDCLLHVPFILHAPGLSENTGAIDALSDHSDIAPTLCQLLRIQPLPGMHGHSLLPLLKSEANGRKAVFADGGHEAEMRSRMDPEKRDGDKQETYSRFPDAMARSICVRTHDHKLVHRETGDHELYALNDDPWELKNRFSDPALAPVREDLMQQLLTWQLHTATDRPHQSHVGA